MIVQDVRVADGAVQLLVIGCTGLIPSASIAAVSIEIGRSVTVRRFSIAWSSGVWLNSTEIGLSSFSSISYSAGVRVRR